MDNLDQHRIDLTAMRSILSVRDTWIISLLYIGTFGSFIGFSFAFGQVLQINFAAGGQNAAQASLHAAQIAFIGPLLGSLSRVYGGKLADRIGGSRVTLAVFAGLIAAASLLIGVSIHADQSHGIATTVTMIGYVVGFIALFVLSGLGNGSVYKMIPSIFDARSRSLNISEPERQHWSRAMSGALIGFAGAIGALGGVGINLELRHSYLTSGSATSAFWIFVSFYLTASILTWAMYIRRPVAAQLPSEITSPAASFAQV
jgi:NNP family nitrate/nitrite transporter-like MFS transporter